MKQAGKWHGDRYYIGYHYDIHASENDPTIGSRVSLDDLLPSFKTLKVDFIQTDCKGHKGYTSWFSATPEASVAGGMKSDALKGWRAATKKLRMPLHCHYSGIWDRAATTRHPDWAVVCRESGVPADPYGQNVGAPSQWIICPRSPYLEEVMIPQLIELIDNWDIDGFWIDGDLWAVVPCYCGKCLKAFTEKTGITAAPTEGASPHWPAWMNFVRESFEEYVTRYVDAVHAHKPGVLVCSNWLQTYRNPGKPLVPTDWISGDNTYVFAVDDCRCESRFISTRGKHWDIMIWAFYKTGLMKDSTISPWIPKPVQMLQQEAAIIAACGGSVQFYDHHAGIADGRLISWRVKQIAEAVAFIRKRQSLCQNSEPIRQVVVLHSEHHARAHMSSNLMWGVDLASSRGATLSLLENHYGVDIMDEWALLDALDDFSLVISPEQDDLSEEMVFKLKEYVIAGGKLIVSGARAFERFGGDFLGCAAGSVEEKATYYLINGNGANPVYSEKWRLAHPSSGRGYGTMGTSFMTDENLLDIPPVIINKAGKGTVAYVPFDIFRYFDRNHYIFVRQFVGKLAARLIGKQPITVSGPSAVDVVLRRNNGRTIIHFINRTSGISNRPNDGAIDEIPRVGPLTAEVRLDKRPRKVWLAFEDAKISTRFTAAAKGGTLRIEVPSVHIHAVVVIEP